MKDKMNRRGFLKSLGVLGAGTALTMVNCKKELTPEEQKALDKKESKKKYPQVPKRKLGKTGLMVPVLHHGIMYNLLERQIVLRNGLKWGINFIDTANAYAGGNSELGIGKFIKKNPDKRKDLILMTKGSGNMNQLEGCLQSSLKRMNTSYIDIYHGVHGLSDPAMLTKDLRKWSEKAKKRKLIRHFGFSIHKNVAKSLLAASKLDWIDVILTIYNFRIMQDPAIQDAIEACHQAGIGLIAMKLQAMKIQTDGDQKLVNQFLKKGLTDGQAKIKAVLEDERISSACVTMGSTALVTLNASAVADGEGLSRGDHKLLRQYASQTKSCYCPGCADICDSVLPEVPFVSDIMRFLMYHNSYGEKEMARERFLEIPDNVRNRLAAIDYTDVESACPHQLPVGSFIKEAIRKLS